MKQGFGHTGSGSPDGTQQWQVRINLSDEFAAAARENAADPVLKPVLDVLAKYNAVLKHQEASFGSFLPYFEKEERPALIRDLIKKLSEVVVKTTEENDSVEASIAALKAYEEASAAYAERERLYLWTKDTLAKPETQKKYATRFTVYAEGDKETYSKAIADALEADLKALVDSGVVTKVDKFDSDPAHNPQAPRKFR